MPDFSIMKMHHPCVVEYGSTQSKFDRKHNVPSDAKRYIIAGPPRVVAQTDKGHTAVDPNKPGITNVLGRSSNRPGATQSRVRTRQVEYRYPSRVTRPYGRVTRAVLTLGLV